MIIYPLGRNIRRQTISVLGINWCFYNAWREFPESRWIEICIFPFRLTFEKGRL